MGNIYVHVCIHQMYTYIYIYTIIVVYLLVFSFSLLFNFEVSQITSLNVCYL